ncbi:MAG: hypothetical protein KGI97_01535 [Alphaproteobacteria bacterium]|nr:hypothetical protein [Alphaproteobacteria bacterium]
MRTARLLRTAVVILVLAVLGIATYRYLTTPDTRSTSQRLGDAIHALPQGLDKAKSVYEDRTPGQKLGDDIKNIGNKIGNKIKGETGSR